MRVTPIFAARIAGCCVAALVSVLAMAGCGAGQITQTDRQIAAVDGTFGDIGNSIALRNVLIPYPRNPSSTYPIGSSVPVLLAIVNQGSVADELVAVSSPAASQVLVMGTTQIPPGTTVLSTTDTASSMGSSTDRPASPLVIGELRVLLTAAEPLRAGLNTPVTFQFRNAGKLTLSVPMGASPTSAS